VRNKRATVGELTMCLTWLWLNVSVDSNAGVYSFVRPSAGISLARCGVLPAQTAVSGFD